VPERFYKYVSAATAEIVLTNRTLRWSTPGTLNDPFDMQFDLAARVNEDRVCELALQKLWDALYGDGPIRVGNSLGRLLTRARGAVAHLTRAEFDRQFGETLRESLAVIHSTLPSLHATVRAHFATCKVLCLTDDPANMLMWSHYADQHRGAVLEFVSAPGLDSPWRTARRIQYEMDVPPLMNEELLASILAGESGFDKEEIIQRMVYTKSAAWAYEREWRIFTGVGRDVHAPYEDIPFAPQELAGVILGCRVDEAAAVRIREILNASYAHAVLSQSVQGPSGFRLAIRPLGAADGHPR
jgi:hypothetical protein